MKKFLTAYIIIVASSAMAQDSTKKETSSLTFSGYVDAYYGYDFHNPKDGNRPFFVYSYNRHNEFNVNLAFLKGSYSTDRVRANFAIGAGTYMNANYVAEPGVLKNIYEADAGYQLSKKKNFWFDIGIMPSHIGFEGAVSKDCWSLTRCLLADNTPYFEGGAKLTYTTDDGKWLFSALVLNGWQRITRLPGNSLLSWGTQVYVKPNDKVTLNYSTFLGTDKPDSARLWRIYHNIYGIFQFTSKIGLTTGFDIGMEQKTMNNSNYNAVYSPVGILRFTPNDKWAIAIRGEYYSDKNGVIIGTGSPNGFQTTGLSVNVDFIPVKNAALRLELKNLNSKDKIFAGIDGNPTKTNTAMTFSAAISF